MAKKTKRRTLRGVDAVHPVSQTKKCRITIGPNATNNRVQLRDVKECASLCSNNYFEPGTMRFFGSRMPETAYADGKGGAYFTSSEKGPSGARRYSVRHYANCSFDTIGKFQGYATAGAATTAAKKLAAGGKGLAGAKRKGRR